MPVAQGYPMVERIMDFEMGELSANATVELFAHLVKTGLAWGLQGSYGRAARSLIDRGIISPEGEVMMTLEPVGGGAQA